MKNLEKRFLNGVDWSVDETGDGLPKIRGTAVVYDRLSEWMTGDHRGRKVAFREIIAPGTFDGHLDTADVRALVDHDSSKILGRNKSGTLRMIDGPGGLQVEIDTPDTSYARDLLVSIKRGDVSGMSFGFVPNLDLDDWSQDAEGLVRTVRSADIFDVSVVTYPAYRDTSVSLRSYERWIEEQRPKVFQLRDLYMAKIRLAEIG